MKLNYQKSILSLLILVIISGLNFSLPESTPENDKVKKTKHCKQILKELATVSGLSSIEIPDIEVVDPLKNQSLAIAMFYDEGNPTIQVHEWTYDICMSLLGRDSINGLVFIIAHELAHLIENHEERPLFQKQIAIDSNDIRSETSSQFPTEINEINKASKMDSLIRSFRGITKKYNIRKNEAEADLHAGFTAYLAGYDTRRAAATFFDSTYKYFKLDTEKGKYISKEERKIIVEGTAKQLDTLIQVFEMANLLTISGSYEVATHCYKYINKHYSSPTLLNNTGLTLILETLDWFPMDLNYYLPLTINTSFVKTDIDYDGVGGGGLHIYELTNEDLINKLNLSIRYFKEIQLTHPSHYEAHLNESIANFLISVINDDQESLIFAKASAYQAKKILEKKENIGNKTMADVYCMLAIIEDRYANYEQASKLFNEAKKYNPTNYLIELNSGIGLKNKDQTSTSSSQKIETILLSEQPVYTLKLDSLSNSNCAPDTISNNYQSLSGMYSEAKAPWILNLDLGQGNFGTLRIKIKSFPESILYAAISEGVSHPKAQQFILEYKQDSQQISDCGIKIGDSWSIIKELYGNKPELLLSNSGNYLNYFYIPKIMGRHTHGTIFYTKNNFVEKWYKYEHQEVNFYFDNY